MWLPSWSPCFIYSPAISIEKEMLIVKKRGNLYYKYPPILFFSYILEFLLRRDPAQPSSPLILSRLCLFPCKLPRLSNIVQILANRVTILIPLSLVITLPAQDNSL